MANVQYKSYYIGDNDRGYTSYLDSFVPLLIAKNVKKLEDATEDATTGRTDDRYKDEVVPFIRNRTDVIAYVYRYIATLETGALPNPHHLSKKKHLHN